MSLELVETPNEEYWKARVYWTPTKYDSFMADNAYSTYLANQIRLRMEVIDWCKEQEGDSMMLPTLCGNSGVAFTNIADATAFALVWSARISETA